MNDEPWPDLEPMRCKFKVGDLVEYHPPATWLSSWSDIPIREGDTGIVERVGSDRGSIDLYVVRFFSYPQDFTMLTSPWLRKVE